MFQCVMDVVKVVVQLKNDINTLPSTEYISSVKVRLGLGGIRIYQSDNIKCLYRDIST